jgi:hypothetical protein
MAVIHVLCVTDQSLLFWVLVSCRVVVPLLVSGCVILLPRDRISAVQYQSRGANFDPNEMYLDELLAGKVET